MAERMNEIRAYISNSWKWQWTTGTYVIALIKGKRIVGYNKTWETEFSWLVPVYTEEIVSGILCSVCKQHSTKNKYKKSSK